MEARVATLETGIGAKIVALSQEIPNWAELVLPIS